MRARSGDGHPGDRELKVKPDELDPADNRAEFNLITFGKSKALRAMFSRPKKAANTQATVLISGDSGTGKEPIALALHSHSDSRSLQ